MIFYSKPTPEIIRLALKFPTRNVIINKGKKTNPMTIDLQKSITLNQNMLRYAQMNINQEAYLYSACVLKQIEKSLRDISAKYHEDFRIYILKAKVQRKVQEVFKKGLNAKPKQIIYGSPQSKKNK